MRAKRAWGWAAPVLAIPSLRERRDDIPLLVRTLLARHVAGRTVRVSRAAMDRLCSFDWPGNVRQLENEIRRALVLADGDLDVEHLSEAVAGSTGSASTGDTSGSATMRGRIDALETSLVREALGETGGNLTQAAKDLGVSRFGLQKMLKRLQIERPQGDAEPQSAAPAPKNGTRAPRVRR